ncbi:peptidoglycan recognition protein family protein [Lampropedia aestuarii]|uniref:peptidoglycan recognition protein family protein n=1 Tax=Lampropedia aestuarii TaxID=2562762 RepID=UPI00246983B5|nr:peptidoglycan recognition family protein [Lampropedia aestuarii]MDH5856722.1 peptidoglycan recognition family protein [Lampropedia aestuarii]
MFEISEEGMIESTRIIKKRYEKIEKGAMTHIAGIIIHQTNAPTAQATFNSYSNGIEGAHFLIDRDGKIYQTASIGQITWHVGKIRARCIAEKRCSPQENKLEQKWNPTATYKRQMEKQGPDRYPANIDSIGIEIVGQALPLSEPDEDKRTYEALSDEQSSSLRWLISELSALLNISSSEIFRHSTISYKNKTEAESASW